ncbi:MAG: glycerophosphodiester phosphodiesterase family protein [Bacteroidales bacterium]|nr:glycerophosphodiester phosphodiesterase family protein [Bacteroidales bacterium]
MSPELVGKLHEDTLKYINEYQLLASSPAIHKTYASVSAMQGDASPKSDLTGRALLKGQLVIIVPASSTDATAGDVYRYNGPSGNTSGWTYVAKIGKLELMANVTVITSTNDAIPNIDTKSKILDLGADPILLVGKKSYALKTIHTDTSVYRSISLMDIEESETSAVRVVFNTSSQTLYSRKWADDLTSDEVLVGGIRKNTSKEWDYNFPFDYTIDGHGGIRQIIANQKNIADHGNAIQDLKQSIFQYTTQTYKPEYTIAYQDYQILNGLLSSQAGYVVTAPIPLKKGDILNLKCYVGGTAQAISLTDAEGSYYAAISSGNGYTERAYTATEDCYVALSWLVLNEYPVILSVNGSSYIPLIKERVDELENVTIPSILEDIEDLKNPTSGASGNGVNVSLISSLDSAIPNIDTSAKTLDLGVDSILLVGGQYYLMKSIHSDTSAYRAISLDDIEGTDTSAVKLVFNTTSKKMYARIWDAELSSDEVLVGGIRKNYTSEWECNLPFDFTIDGKRNTPSVSVAGGKDNISLITSLNDAIPNIDTKSKILDLGSDPIVLAGGLAYALKGIHPDASVYRAIPFDDIDGTGTSAIMMVFNTTSKKMYARAWTATLADDEMLVGGIRKNTTMDFEYNFPFKYTINGVLPGQQEDEYKEGQLGSKTSLKFIAHRGLHLQGIPENSLMAYHYAGRCGFDFAETDFCPTSDGVLVLMHDDTINRTMANADNTDIVGDVSVSEHTFADLRNHYRFKSSDPRFRMPIPTLEEFFIQCRKSGIFPLPEIKSFGMTQEYVKDAHDLGCKIMGEGNFGFCSFSTDFLDYARSLSEKTLLLYIVKDGILNTVNAVTGQSRVAPNTWWYPTWDAASYGDYGLTVENVRSHKEAGIPVAVWTTPVEEFDNMLNLEVDALAGDYLSPNLAGRTARIAVADDSFKQFRTDGSEVNLSLYLSAGQTCSFNAGNMWLGGYYLNVMAQGHYTILSPRLYIENDDDTMTRHIYQGIGEGEDAIFMITAIEDTRIDSIEWCSVSL